MGDRSVSKVREKKEAYWRRQFSQYKSSGTSVVDFCRRRRIPVHQFYWWKRKLSSLDAQDVAGQAEDKPILRRSGLTIHRSTQWRWMRGLSQLLTPLVNLIRNRLLAAQVLGIDETPIPILDPDLDHTRTAYLYAQYGDDTQPYVGYYFAPQKTRVNIERMLDRIPRYAPIRCLHLL